MKYDIDRIGVDVGYLDRAIGGDADAIAGAFYWLETPQCDDFWVDQRNGKTPLDIDALEDIKRQYMHHTGAVGKLKDMHVKAGDVVRHCDGSTYTIKERRPGVLANWHNSGLGGWGVDVSESEQDYTLISLAEDAQPDTQPDTPKTWGEMTDAEKGALLLAAHEGKVIEAFGVGCDHTGKTIPEWSKCFPVWVGDKAYRVKPEPVRETVSGWWNGKNFHNTANYADRTHRITFDTIDGEPDCSTIKMERITKEESK